MSISTKLWPFFSAARRSALEYCPLGANVQERPDTWPYGTVRSTKVPEPGVPITRCATFSVELRPLKAMLTVAEEPSGARKMVAVPLAVEPLAPSRRAT